MPSPSEKAYNCSKTFATLGFLPLSWGPLKGAMSAQKALQRSETETRELVKHFFHYVFSTNSFLPFTWFLLNPFMYFALQFSRHVFSTDVIHAFYPTFFDSRDLHLSRSCILPYVFSMMCFTLKLITHFTLGFFQHVFSTKAFHTFYPRFFRARAFHWMCSCILNFKFVTAPFPLGVPFHANSTRKNTRFTLVFSRKIH